MIIITGASSGLGLETTKLYKADGKMVVNVSRRESAYADVNICRSLREGPEIEAVANEIDAMEEPIEALIHCAGVYNNQEFGTITEDEIKRLMSTNVKASMLLTSLLIERIKRDEADVLSVLSTAALLGKPKEPLYAASKWGERGFTLSLQEALKGTPCRVIAFCPGGMQTDFFAKHTDNRDVSEFMNPEDIATALKQTLDLPKSIEVSEIVLNRK